MTMLDMTVGGFFTPHTDRGLGLVAKSLTSRIEELRDGMTATETLGKSYRETLNALYEVYQECSSENWDGYRAQAVSESDFKNAIRFLDTLPTVMPRPEISVDPDGEFAFEWYRSPESILTVSIGHFGRLSFAARIGRKRAHGTDYFADELPAVISENLERLYSQRY